MSASDSLSHNLFFDKWHGKAFRIAATPSGRATARDTGEKLPDDPNRWSIVTPENKGAWNWPAGTEAHMKAAKEAWPSFVKDPEAKYKQDQIRRSVKRIKKADAKSARRAKQVKP